MLTELSWISEVKDIAFSILLLGLLAWGVRGAGDFLKIAFCKYLEWRKEEQELKEKRALAYQKNSAALVLQISEVVKTSQEGTKVILESLSKGAERDQTRHESVMTCFGGLLRDVSQQGIERR